MLINFKNSFTFSLLLVLLVSSGHSTDLSISLISYSSIDKYTISYTVKNMGGAEVRLDNYSLKLSNNTVYSDEFDDPDILIANEERTFIIALPNYLKIVSNVTYQLSITGKVFTPYEKNLTKSLDFVHTFSETQTLDYTITDLTSDSKYALSFIVQNIGTLPIERFNYSLTANGTTWASGELIPSQKFTANNTLVITIPADRTIKSMPNDNTVGGASYTLQLSGFCDLVNASQTKNQSISHSWETVPNDPLITSSEGKYTGRTSISFSIGNVRLFKYKLDGGDWSDWFNKNEKLKFNGLQSEAHHSFKVIGADENDNVNLVPVEYNWTINTLNLASPGENYRISQIMNNPVKTDDEITGLLPGEIIQTVSYADSYGRKTQDIAVRSSSVGKKDMIVFYEYDKSGRQSKNYLPFVGAGTLGIFDNSAKSNQSLYYKGDGYDSGKKIDLTYKPFSETQYAISPFDKIQKQGSVGETWQINYEPLTEEVDLGEWSSTYTGSTFSENEIFTFTQQPLIALDFVLQLTTDINTTRNISPPAALVVGSPSNSIAAVAPDVDPEATIVYTVDGYVRINYLDGTFTDKSLTSSAEYDYDYAFSVSASSSNPISSIAVVITSVNISAGDVSIGNTDLKLTMNGTKFRPSAPYLSNLEFKASSNTINNEIVIWDCASSKPVKTGFYGVGQLLISHTIDENNNSSYVYTDKSGKELLKKSQNLVNGQTVDVMTYYVYDDLGNLRFIIPPMAVAEIQSTAWLVTDEIKSKWLTEFRYDSQNRVVYKKIPEADPIYTVYDRLGRVVLTQDGNLRLTNKWMYTKYDINGRSIVTGIYTHTSSVDQAAMQSVLDNEQGLYEVRTGTNAYSQKGYTQDKAFPTDFSKCELLTVTYYDDYDYDNNGTPDVLFDNSDGNYPGSLAFYRLKNKVTGSLQRILGSEPIQQSNAVYSAPFNSSNDIKITGNNIKLKPGFMSLAGQKLVINSGTEIRAQETADQWLTSVSFFDKYGRVIQSQSTTYLTANDVTDKQISNTQYDFSGKVIKTKFSHKTQFEITPIEVRQRFTYDHAGRLLDTFQKVNAEVEILVKRNIYNELGQLIEKKLYSDDIGVTFLETVVMKNNVRGWLTDVNSSVYNQKLYYNENVPALYAGLTKGTAQFNGNISGVRWDRGNGTSAQIFGYEYDKLNQLINSDYGQTGAFNSTAFEEKDLKYDLNGNITGLTRTATNGSNMDVLQYGYNGNKLMSVSDAVTASAFTADFDTKLPAETAYEVVFHENFENITGSLTASANWESLVAPSTDYTVQTFSGQGKVLRITQNNHVYHKLTSKAIPVIANAQYRLSAFTAISDGWGDVGRGVKLLWYGYDSGNTLVPVGTAMTIGVDENTGMSFSVTTASPANAVYARIVVEFNCDVQSPGQDMYFDDIKLEALPIYDYDANGNMTLDANKGMVISYNLLNLPTVIDFGNGNKIEWIYTATGTKVRKNVYENNSLSLSKSRDYAGGFEYIRQTGLEFFGMGEGRIRKIAGNPQYNYEFDIKDHLGNVRSTIRDKYPRYANLTIQQKENLVTVGQSLGIPDPHQWNSADLEVEISNLLNNRLEVIQVDDYYSFGMRISKTVSSDQNNYLYNGKELNNDFGLNWYHYGARFYDPTVGRWWSVDPMDVERSPYNYVFNNPLNFIDPDGRVPNELVFNENGVYLKTIVDKYGWDRVTGRIENSNGDIIKNFIFNEIDIRDQLRLNLADQHLLSIKLDINFGNRVEDLALAGLGGNSNRGIFGSLFYAVRNSFGGGSMDYTSSSLQDEYTFYLSDNTAYNRFDAGNFLWGVGMAMSGINYNTAKTGSELNAFFFAKKQNGEPISAFRLSMSLSPRGDSVGDQRAILSGYSWYHMSGIK